MTRDFGGVIWTNHALDRLKEREISQGDAWVAFTKSDDSRYAESEGGWVYTKVMNGWKYEVVAKQNEKKEWVILSVWAKPVIEKRNTKQHWVIRVLKKVLFGSYR